jgi:ribosomal protein S18 acetylase RimI-like enzyme
MRELRSPPGDVRAATVAEAGEALAILVEATAWSARFGEPIWPIGSFTLDEQKALAAAGELVGGFDRGQMSACMRLQPKDDLVWPGDPPGEALYVHKVAVRRDAAGQGWASTLMEYAVSQARAAGAAAVRLDTVPHARMIGMYEAFGFSTVDPGALPFGGRMLVRMERGI